jgi:hypothetical protein
MRPLKKKATSRRTPKFGWSPNATSNCIVAAVLCFFHILSMLAEYKQHLRARSKPFNAPGRVVSCQLHLLSSSTCSRSLKLARERGVAFDAEFVGGTRLLHLPVSSDLDEAAQARTLSTSILMHSRSFQRQLLESALPFQSRLRRYLSLGDSWPMEAGA